MIIARLIGGLGNQLHVLSAGISTAAYFETKLIIDISLIPQGSNIYREYCSAFFLENVSKVQFRVVSFENMSNIQLLEFSKINMNSESRLYLDSNADADTQLRSLSDNSIIYGHFLDFSWAERAMDFDFPFPKINHRKIINRSFLDKSTIHVHVRLGDYLNHASFFPRLPERYYLESIQRYRTDETIIKIFSDDIKNLRLLYPNLVSMSDSIIGPRNKKENPLATFLALTRCNMLITSNSTFSSWAGFLSNCPIVVTPIPHLYDKQWKDSFPINWKRFDLINETWITQ
jgi:hypothetical protein